MKYFVYFSLTGNGDYLASLMEEKGYTPIKVEMVKRPKKVGFFTILKFGGRAGFKKKEKIQSLNMEIKPEDEVVIGSPVWNDRLSTPILTVLDQYNFNKETTRFVFYPAGETVKKAYKQIMKMGFTKGGVTISYPVKKKEEAEKIIKDTF